MQSASSRHISEPTSTFYDNAKTARVRSGNLVRKPGVQKSKLSTLSMLKSMGSPRSTV